MDSSSRAGRHGHSPSQGEDPAEGKVKLGRVVPGPGHSPRVTDDESWRRLVPPSVAVRKRLAEGERQG